MYIYVIIGLLILCGILLCVIGIRASATKCIEQLRDNMPINEWVSFAEAVKISKSPRWVAQACLHTLAHTNRIEARPTKALEDAMRKRVEKILERVPPEERDKGVVIVINTGFWHVSHMEFLLRVRPNAPRRVEEEVEAPDFALPQGI